MEHDAYFDPSCTVSTINSQTHTNSHAHCSAQSTPRWSQKRDLDKMTFAGNNWMEYLQDRQYFGSMYWVHSQGLDVVYRGSCQHGK